jgi:hypothetical protein
VRYNSHTCTHGISTDIPIHIVARFLQFLTLLCVLICSSSFIIIRGWLQRRRIRVEIQQAVDRGEITARRGEQLNVRLDTMTWSMGRWSASWLTLLSDDLAERSNPMYGRTGGRRRRKARDLGPVPKLYEFEMKEEKENRDRRASVYSNELPAYQVSCLPQSQRSQYSRVDHATPQPFSVFHPTSTPIVPLPSTTIDNEPRRLVNYNINVPRNVRTAERYTRHPAARQQWQNTLFSSSDNTSPPPDFRISMGYPSPVPPPSTDADPPNSPGPTGDTTADELEKCRGNLWIERVTHSKDDSALPVEASFLIKMPESEATARYRRRIRQEEGEEMLHPPTEIAIWKGILQR